MRHHHLDHRSAAFALLNCGAEFREKEGNFLGGMAFRNEPPTQKQRRWLDILLERHGFASLSISHGVAGHA